MQIFHNILLLKKGLIDVFYIQTDWLMIPSYERTTSYHLVCCRPVNTISVEADTHKLKLGFQTFS